MLSQSDASLAMIGIGLFVLTSGVLFRVGRLRYQASEYWRSDWPMVFRNGPFAQIPIGFAALLIGLGMRLDDGGLAALGGLVSLLIGLIWVVAPPEFAKPTWIRVREEERGSDESSSALERRSWWLAVGLFALGLGIIAGIWSLRLVFQP